MTVIMDYNDVPTASAFNILPAHDEHISAPSIQVETFDTNTSECLPCYYDPDEMQLLALLYPKWPSLAVDDCNRIRNDNLSFWSMLDFHSNLTTGSSIKCIDHAPSLETSSAVQGIILAVMFVLSLVGNVLTIYR